MLRVLADHPDNTVAADDLAFIAYFLDGRSYFHVCHHRHFLLAVCAPRLIWAPVIRPFGSYIETSTVAAVRAKSDVIHPQLAGYML